MLGPKARVESETTHALLIPSCAGVTCKLASVQEGCSLVDSWEAASIPSPSLGFLHSKSLNGLPLSCTSSLLGNSSLPAFPLYPQNSFLHPGSFQDKHTVPVYRLRHQLVQL